MPVDMLCPPGCSREGEAGALTAYKRGLLRCRPTEKGNARSLSEWDGNKYRFPRFFVFQIINPQKSASVSGVCGCATDTMERILMLFVSCLVALMGFTGSAQSTQVATLMSGEDVKIFMGPEALKEAVDASADGDVITLSAGSFDSPGNIKNSLTIRGAGMGLEAYKPYVIPTIINGTVDIYNNIDCEGLRFQDQVFIWNNPEQNLSFSKCYIYGFFSHFNVKNNLTLVDCFVNLAIWTKYMDLVAINSILLLDNTNNLFHGNFINCIIGYYKTGGLGCVDNSTFTNSIIYCTGSSVMVPISSAAFYNCLFYGKNGNGTFDEMNQNGTNKVCNDVTTVFKEDGFFQLLEEYKAFKGTDGKEVGIYGGNLGFDVTPNNPQITRFDVAPKTSVDGKLSIEIEVKGAE
ncbi:MAG: hypothetical protein HDS26_02335 [Bacteroides sp.]|nr:hypothetical protein [Bacteroides sp.]MBD5289507.1 hypothetical protein [Bacteroides sp.]